MRQNYSFTLVLLLLLCHFTSSGQLRQIYLDIDDNNAIHKINFYSPNEGYVAFTKWIGFTTDSGRTMSRIYITNSNVDYNGYSVNLTFGFGIAGIKAFDRNTLIAYGDYGLIPAILYSANAGTSWKLVFQSQFDPAQISGGVTDLAFPQNDNIGYAVDADRILKTTDKGLSWSMQLAAAGSYFDHIETIDDNNLLVMSTGAGSYGTNKVLKTINGGASWGLLPLPIQEQVKLDYAYFLDANTGWLSLFDKDQNAFFYKTTTAGGIWQQLNDKDATPFGCSRMYFADENTGYATTFGYEAYKTLNGGVTWEPLPRDNKVSNPGWNYDMQCFSATQLWMGGGHGFLELSTNGGGTPLPTAYFKIDTTGVYATGQVSLLNYSRPGYQNQWLVNNVSVSTGFNATYSHTLASAMDSIQLVVSTGGHSDTAKKFQRFLVPVLPSITSFSPVAGGAGTLVTIRGTGFTNVTGVRFATAPAASFTIASDTVIQAVAGTGASGSIVLTDIHGNYMLGGFTFFPASSAPVPVITSISPSAAPVGATVTISGRQFDPSAIVSFGSIRANVQSATATAIVCTVPFGASYGPISVLNAASGLSAQSPRVFNISFPDSSNFTPNSFVSAWSYKYGDGYYPYTVKGKDIDGDGKPDLIAFSSGFGLSSILVFRNTSSRGKISFDQPVSIEGFPPGIAFNDATSDINDLDGDGKADILIATGNHIFSVLKNTSTIGAISFVSAANVSSNIGTGGAVIADLDNDGLNDMAFAATDSYHTGIAVTRNTGIKGTLAFGPTQLIQGGSGLPGGIAAGDLDGDGKTDLVLSDGDSSFSIFLNNSTPGNIVFTHRTDIRVPGLVLNGHAIMIAHFQGLDRPDIIVGNDQYFAIYSNHSGSGTLSFDAPVLMPVPQFGQGASLGNYSGGSRPDILTGVFGENYQVLFRNTSSPGAIHLDSAFRVPSRYVYGTVPADFDGDGKTDIIDCYSNDGQVVVFENNMGIPVDFTICTGQPVPYQLTSDISGNTYRWQQDRGAGFVAIIDNDSLSGSSGSVLSFKNTPANWAGFRFRCLVDGGYSSAFRLHINKTVSPGIDYTVSDSTICYRNQIFFTATPQHGNTGDYSYKWQINGVGIANPDYSMPYRYITNELQDKDQVRVILQYSDACGYYRSDTSRAITMSVIYPVVNISTSTAQPCVGQPVTFTATGTNIGPGSVYKWEVNGQYTGDNSPIYTTSALQGTSGILLVVDMSAFCGETLFISSNVIDIAIVDTTQPQVTIKASTSGIETSGGITICAGNPISFTATASNTGPAPAYQWLVNGAATAASLNDITWTSSGLQDQDVVQCLVTGSSACVVPDVATSDGIIITVHQTVIPSVEISASQNEICSGTTALFTALPHNQGDKPTYQWSRDGVAVGDNSPVYSGTNWANGETVTVALISNASCAAPDTVTSSTLPVSVISLAVTVNGDSVLAHGTALTLSAMVNNGGGSPQYQWEDSTTLHSWQAISGANMQTLNYMPAADGDAVRCSVTGATGCNATSRPIKFRFSGTATIRYYPNPATSVLYIDNPDASDPINSLAVATINGNKVGTLSGLTGKVQIAIDLGSLSPGVYFIQAERSSGKTVSFEFQKK